MNLRRALDRAIAERYPVRLIRSPIASARGLAARVHAVMREHGVNPKAWGDRKTTSKAEREQVARALGTVPDTVTRWLNGQRKPSKAHLDAVERGYQRAVREQQQRAAGRDRDIPRGVAITAEVEWGSDPGDKKRYFNTPAYRTVRPAHYTGGVHLGPVFGAWARGESPAAVEAAFMRAVKAAEDGPDMKLHFHGDDVVIRWE